MIQLYRVAWNMGSVQYIFWVGSACLIQFINNIVWKDNAINWAPVWCDISGWLYRARANCLSPLLTLATRWTLGSSISIGSCSLVIMRRLYHIANITTIHVSREDRRRMIIEDIAVGSGIPILVIILCTLIMIACTTRKLIRSRLVCSRSSFRHFRGHWVLASNSKYGPFLVHLRPMAYLPRNDVRHVLWCVAIPLR